jgi:hypothetical protein
LTGRSRSWIVGAATPTAGKLTEPLAGTLSGAALEMPAALSTMLSALAQPGAFAVVATETLVT